MTEKKIMECKACIGSKDWEKSKLGELCETHKRRFMQILSGDFSEKMFDKIEVIQK